MRNGYKLQEFIFFLHYDIFISQNEIVDCKVSVIFLNVYYFQCKHWQD